MHCIRGESVRRILSLETALFYAVHDYPGGVPAVAGALGCNPNTLQNKLNIRSPEPHPTLRDFRDILSLTGDARILDAVCAPVGFVPVQVPDMARVTDTDLLSGVSAAVKTLGELTGELAHALEGDNEIDDAELDALNLAVHQVHKVVNELKARIHARHDARLGQVRPGELRSAG